MEKINITTKRILYTSILTLCYWWIAYYLFASNANSVLTTVVSLPILIWFVVDYAAGSVVGYIFMGLEFLLIWFFIYLLVRKALPKGAK